MAKFNFKTQLSVGKQSEAMLHLKFPQLEKLEGRGPDFKLGEKYLELKTDSYDYLKTGNLFMERWSVLAKQSPGGPWQALSKGSDLFLYLFSKYNHLYVFDVQKLIEHLEANESTYKYIDVPNKGYTTRGYLVPVKGVMHLTKMWELEDELSAEEVFSGL